MRSTNCQFITAESKKRLAAIVEYVRSNDGVTVKQVSAQMKMTAGGAGRYLRQAASQEQIRRERPIGILSTPGMPPDIWVGIDTAPLFANGIDERDHYPRKVKIRKSWTPNNVRDPLIAALFGPAQHREQQ